MKREELERLLSGQATPEEKARLAVALEASDDANEVNEAFVPPAPPDVFTAAFETAHPPAPAWWRSWAFAVAALATVALVFVLWPRVDETHDGIKGTSPAPEVSVLWVVLDGVPHRLTPGEPLRTGARLGARVTAPRAAWLALEESRGGAWVRVWPTTSAGHALHSGEQELGDEQGAFVLRLDGGPWRWVVAAQPFDAPGEQVTVPLGLEVTP